MTAPRRPAGWIAPGPPPAGPGDRPELVPGPDEELSYLAGDWRLFQRRSSGHRWSLDDLMTAWVATRDRDVTQPVRALDLGCGQGSVLLLVAWKLPHADVTGIEAQADRAALGRRSIAYDGCADRCRIVDGDLREDLDALGGGFALVTGTPPYFPRGTGVESAKPHAAPCRFELRGGVEDYLAAAARAVTADGTIVVCTAAREQPLVEAGAWAAGLAIHARWEIVPRDGKPPLIAVDVLGPAPAPRTDHSLTVRDRAGAWTPEFRAVRAAMGMPDRPPGASA